MNESMATEQIKDYTKGMCAVWIEDGVWTSATVEMSNKMINDRVQSMGLRDADTWVRLAQMIMVPEADRAAEVLKRQISAACSEVCDKRFALHYPVITPDITDEHYFHAFSGWSTRGLPLADQDMEIITRHLGGSPISDEVMKQVRNELEFTVCGYCGL